MLHTDGHRLPEKETAPLAYPEGRPIHMPCPIAMAVNMSVKMFFPSAVVVSIQ